MVNDVFACSGVTYAGSWTCNAVLDTAQHYCFGFGCSLNCRCCCCCHRWFCCRCCFYISFQDLAYGCCYPCCCCDDRVVFALAQEQLLPSSQPHWQQPLRAELRLTLLQLSSQEHFGRRCNLLVQACLDRAAGCPPLWQGLSSGLLWPV